MDLKLMQRFLPYAVIAIVTAFSLWSRRSSRCRGKSERSNSSEDGDPAEVSSIIPEAGEHLDQRTSGGYEFEVFLSFRGEDTRNGFIGHLYESLQDRGVSTFIDSYKLEKGEKIDKLLEYIDKSKICILIISKRYAESKWCLKEVTKCLECDKEIIPVFFGVEPSDVRNQSGPFKSAFKRYVSDKKLKQEEVKKWKEALKKTGEISGFNLKDMSWDEAKLKRAVIERVLSKVNKKPLVVAKHPIGIETRVQDVKQMLQNGGEGVDVVGIHGMGGLGKTTIAKAVYNDLFQGFDGATCFLSNVRETAGQPNGLVTLQKQIFQEILNDRNIHLNSVAHGASLIKERASNKRVLLVIDDVDSTEQLDALTGGRDWFGAESVIMITTRDEDVLLAHNVKENKIYKPQELNEAQSRELFMLHAFNGEPPQLEEYVELSNEVVGAAGGLPLTLEVVGSLLSFKKNVEEWKDTLEKLKKIPPSRVQQRLRLSFDSLDETEKKIFLDISCFFVGERSEYAIYMWEDCGWFPNTSIRVLVQRSLIKISEKTGLFEMHDQIRDMGRAIVEECSVQKQSRLRMRSGDSLELLSRKVPVTLDAEGISIRPSGSNKEDEKYCVSGNCFGENMPNLRYLDAAHVNFQGTGFPTNLKWLQLDKCDFDSMPSDLNIEKLVILELWETNMAQVFINQFRLKSKAFEKLKVLSIRDVQTNFTLDFTIIPCLVKLELVHCPALTIIDESIGNLKNLTDLCVRGNENVENLPDSIGKLTSLKMLDISWTNVVEIPHSIGKLMNLRELLVQYSKGLSTLPDSICQLSSLQILNLQGCYHLTSLPEQLGDMRSLRNLHLSGTSIVKLPDSIGKLTSLKMLDISGTNVVEIPHSIGKLMNLRELLVQYSKGLSTLPDSICQLSSLEILNLPSCSLLTSLPEQLGDMRSLKNLDLSGTRIVKLPHSIGKLSSLKMLDISGTNVVEIPHSIGKLMNLRELLVQYCKELSTLPDSICQLSSLEILKLSSCSLLKSLPEQLGDMRSLRNLHLSGTSIVKLPDSIGKLSSLKMLDISLTNVVEIPHSIGKLMNLRELLVHSCKGLSSLPDSICQLSYLEILNLGDCSLLTSLPEQLGDMRSLRNLHLSGTSMVKLPDSIGKLSSLKMLDISLTNVVEIPHSIGKLMNLRELLVHSCKGLSTLPDSIFQLSSLEILNLDFCFLLTSLPEQLGDMRSLRNLGLCGTSIVKLPDSICKLSSLQVLDLSWCRRLCCLPEYIGHMGSLKQLHLSGTRIEVIPDSICQLKLLESLHVSNCRDLCNLPERLAEMEKLRELVLDFTGIKSIPGSVERLKNLRLLSLKECNDLQALPNSISNLTERSSDICLLVSIYSHSLLLGLSDRCLKGLKYIHLKDATMEELPDCVGRMENLEELLIECEMLKELPNSIDHYPQKLTELKVSSKRLHVLPDCIGPHKKLKRLTLKCEKLKALPDSIGSLKQLQHLTLECDSLNTLPDSIGELESITCLKIGSEKLEALPNSITLLGRLLDLRLDCINLEAIPDSIGGMKGLEYFSVKSNCLKALPASIGLLKNVEYLTLRCPNLEKLPDSIGELQSLRYFRVDSDVLAYLPNSMGTLRRLQQLTLHCDRFSVSPDFIGCLKHLRSFTFKSSSLQQFHATIFGSSELLLRLSLSGCENLEAVTGLAHLSCLQSIDLEGCKRLVYLPPLPSSLLSLSALDCTNLKAMSDLSGLKSLENLNLGGCKLLEGVPGLENISDNLEKLELPCPCDFTDGSHLCHDFEINKMLEKKEATFKSLIELKTSGSLGGSATGKQLLQFMLPRLPFFWLRRSWLQLWLEKVVPPIHVMITTADDIVLFEKIVEDIKQDNVVELHLKEECFLNTVEGDEEEHCYKIQVTTDMSSQSQNGSLLLKQRRYWYHALPIL